MKNILHNRWIEILSYLFYVNNENLSKLFLFCSENTIKPEQYDLVNLFKPDTSILFVLNL